MAARLQLARNCKVRVHVAERTIGGEHNLFCRHVSATNYTCEGDKPPISQSDSLPYSYALLCSMSQSGAGANDAILLSVALKEPGQN
jgi:hypothetical protein